MQQIQKLITMLRQLRDQIQRSNEMQSEAVAYLSQVIEVCTKPRESVTGVATITSAAVEQITNWAAEEDANFPACTGNRLKKIMDYVKTASALEQAQGHPTTIHETATATNMSDELQQVSEKAIELIASQQNGMTENKKKEALALLKKTQDTCLKECKKSIEIRDKEALNAIRASLLELEIQNQHSKPNLQIPMKICELANLVWVMLNPSTDCSDLYGIAKIHLPGIAAENTSTANACDIKNAKISCQRVTHIILAMASALIAASPVVFAVYGITSGSWLVFSEFAKNPLMAIAIPTAVCLFGLLLLTYFTCCAVDSKPKPSAQTTLTQDTANASIAGQMRNEY